MKAKVIILAGDGVNCQRETAKAFEGPQCDTKIMELNELIESPTKLREFDILALPGGFSYGDEIHSGQVYALKLKKYLSQELEKFLSADKLILGVCNGFQILVKLGYLPDPFKQRVASLVSNRNSKFINRWEELLVHESICKWSKGLPEKIAMPIRHGEGRLVFSGDDQSQKEIYEKLLQNKQVVFTYENDINGSYQKIAGITDPSGNILGMMPHPEAALEGLLNPLSNNSHAQILFKNAIEYTLQKKGSR